MIENLMPLLARLPEYLGAHLILALSALAIGCLISVPLGVVVARSGRIGEIVTGAAGLLQTIPAIALLALMVPLLGGKIGFLPAFIGLTAYSLLPVLRNTAIGIAEIDPQLIEAARGVGMAGRQRLWLVELPLALPVIIGGIRTSTVWVVGTATLATPVGATSLGNYIFAGLQTRNWLSVTLGCIAAAALAVLLDRLIRTIEIGLRERRLRLVRYAGAGLAAIFLIGVAPAAWQAVQDRMPTSSAPIRQVAGGGGETAPASALAGVRLTIGGKPYTEQYVLAGMLEQWLEARGARVERRDNLGSSVLFEALTQNSVDVAVDFSGTLWANIMERDAPIGRFAMITEVAGYLWDEHGVLSIGPLGYENTYAVGVKPALARRLGLGDLRDFGAHAGELTIASDLEFQGRPEWPRLKRTYGLNGIRARAFDSALLYQAIDENQVDAIVAYTTDGRLDAYDLRLLADPLEALPPYDAMLLLSPEAAAIPGLAAALAPLVGALDEGLMRAANGLVDVEGRPVEAAARFLLREIERRREVPPRDTAGTAKRIESGG